MIKVALRGLAGRKLRALLTAIAIVLGVAMISGTYILTDTVNSAFTTLFTESYAGTDAVVTGRGLNISIDGEKPPNPPVEASLLDTVRGVDGVALATGTVLDERNTKILTPEGNRSAQRAHRHSDSGSTRLPRSLSSIRSTSSRVVGPRRPTRSSSMSAPRTTRATRSATRSTSRPSNRSAPSSSSGSRGTAASTASELQLRRLHDPGGAGAPRPGGPVRRDLGRRHRRHERGPARRGHPACPAGRREGRERHGRSRGTGGRGKRVHGNLPLLPACLRRYRSLRRRVRHLQHVLDHRGAAHARVRHTADDRSVATPGPRVGDPRVAHHRPRRVARRPRSRACVGGRHRGALPRARGRASLGRPRLRDADGDRGARRRYRYHVPRGLVPGNPGHARASDRGGT